MGRSRSGSLLAPGKEHEAMASALDSTHSRTERWEGAVTSVGLVQEGNGSPTEM